MGLFRSMSNSTPPQNYFTSMSILVTRRSPSTLECDGNVLVTEEAKADVVYTFFDEVLATSPQRSHIIDLSCLKLLARQFLGLTERFTEEEVLRVIQSLPLDKATSPDGFTSRFL
jgi:hypothetical protein